MNYNNKLRPTSFNSRLDVRPLMSISDLKLDYELKIGGYNFLPNTSFKTVFNRVISQLASGGNGIYGGSDTIPDATIGTLEGDFTINYGNDSSALALINNSIKMYSEDLSSSIYCTNSKASVTKTSVGELFFSSQSNTIILKDDRSGGSAVGLQYNADYSANYTARSLVDKAYADSKRPYKIYVALLTQTSTNAPVATVLENTLGGTPVFTYDATGSYVCTLASAFTNNKTAIITSTVSGTAVLEPIVKATSISTSVINLETFRGGSAADGVMEKTVLEIRVYP